MLHKLAQVCQKKLAEICNVISIMFYCYSESRRVCYVRHYVTHAKAKNN